MMGFEWFVAGLTDLQVTELQAIWHKNKQFKF
jgi:hypothetical protein